jgi:hypothetical protein
MFGKVLGIQEIDDLGRFQLLHSRRFIGHIPHSVKRQLLYIRNYHSYLTENKVFLQDEQSANGVWGNNNFIVRIFKDT